MFVELDDHQGQTWYMYVHVFMKMFDGDDDVSDGDDDVSDGDGDVSDGDGDDDDDEYCVLL
jgi:hypothetical protein